MQPVMRSVLSSFFNSLHRPSDPLSFSRQQNFILPVSSHLLTEFLLSPLDLIQTRLIIQTSVTRHRRYSGPLDAFRQILRDEGGLYGMYFHPQLFFTTLLNCTFAPLVDAIAPRLTARVLARILGFRIAEDTHPFLWAVAQLAGSCAGLVVTVPFETVRRRLQAQVRGNAVPFATCVEVRRRPYVGIVDCMYSIIVEERSDFPLRPRKRRDRRREQPLGARKEDEEENDGGWMRNSGVGQLYRGLGMRAGASVIIFLLTLFVPTSDSDDGWTEL